jgi:hypothetical protein
LREMKRLHATMKAYQFRERRNRPWPSVFERDGGHRGLYTAQRVESPD